MSGKTILVVDDEESVRSVIREALEMEEIKVLTAVDGQDGWEVYEAKREEIALVLLDLNMPRMSGADLYRKMREVDPDVHVIIITGLKDTDVDDDVRDGANNVLFKPIDINDLTLTVQMTLENPEPPVEI